MQSFPQWAPLFRHVPSRHLPVNGTTLWPCRLGRPEPQIPHLHKGNNLAHGRIRGAQVYEDSVWHTLRGCCPGRGQREGSQHTG